RRKCVAGPALLLDKRSVEEQPLPNWSPGIAWQGDRFPHVAVLLLYLYRWFWHGWF
ncbi:MAG: hypothetical protein ACI8QS_001609, partial [Planctomycetota bacterium]